MVTEEIKKFISIIAQIILVVPVLLGLSSCLWTVDMVTAFDCAEAEVRCYRDSNCLLAMEAHRVTCGPLGRSCISADLNLCHASLVSLQLSSAFNGSCWCHEPTMETRVYHRCLDVHLKIFYHPCIARINSRINGGRRREMEMEQQRKEQEEEKKRQDEARKREEDEEKRRQLYYQQGFTSVTSSVLSTATTATSEEISEAQRREQQRLEFERRLLEVRHRQRLEEREREYLKRRLEWERQRQLATSTSQTGQTKTSVQEEKIVSAARISTGANAYATSTRRTTPYITPFFVYKPDTGSPIPISESVEEEKTAYFTFTETSHTGVLEQTYAFGLVTPRHKIRHFQEKIDATEGGEETEPDFDNEGHSRRHKPSTIVTGDSINGHSISDFSNLFSPDNLEIVNGDRSKTKLSVPGENHWSCTKSLERCLHHVACARLLDLYREKCRVDNQRCVSTDWKSCKDAYEGIRWTGLNNCTCSDNHRLHGPSCHFVELLTAHNQCIDQFKRAGFIADENGAPYFGQPSIAGVTNARGNATRSATTRPDISPTRVSVRNATMIPRGTEEMVKPVTGQQATRRQEPTPILRPNPTRPTITSRPVTTPATATSTQSTTTSPTTTKATEKSTTTKKPPPKPVTRPAVIKKVTTKKIAVKPIASTTAKTVIGKPSLSTENPDEEEQSEEKAEKPQIFIPPQRNPLQPVSRLPLISWDEWNKNRITVSPSLPVEASFKQISNREVALGTMTYRVDSTCQMAFSHCHWDNICSWQLSEIKSYCVTTCEKQRCASAISRFYKYVNADFQEGLTFCTCRAHDTECLEYQNLLFPSCLRQMQRHEWRECGDLKIECRNDDRCWPWAERYFDACRWDSIRGRCAGSPQACRQAILGIRGTPLDTDCACLPNSPECEAIQNALYFRNPCFEEARLTMLPKFTTRRPTTSSTTTTTTRTTTTTTTTPKTTTKRTTAMSTITISTTTASTTAPTSTRRRPVPTRSTTTASTTPEEDIIVYPEEITTTKPRTTTARFRPTTPTTKRPTTTRRRATVADDDEDYDYGYGDQETTTMQTPTSTTSVENVTEETTTPTTTTPPLTTTQMPQCTAVDQETHTFKMRSGRSPVRIYKDRFTRCSLLCQCTDASGPRRDDNDNEDETELIPEPVLDCLSIDCMADIPCPGGTWLGYGAPSFRMTQDKCTCISGEFVCRRPRGEWTSELGEDGLYLTVGYSQKEVEWLVQRLPHDINGVPVDFPHTIDEFLEEMRKELEKNMQDLADKPEDNCELIEHFHEGNNFIFEVRRVLKRPPEEVAQDGYTYDSLLDEVCRSPVRRLERALDEDKFRNDVILSVVKEAIVDDRLPTSGSLHCGVPLSMIKIFVLYSFCSLVIRRLCLPG